MRIFLLFALLIASATEAASSAQLDHSHMVRIPAGAYTPFFQGNPGKGKLAALPPEPVPVASFRLDIAPVTNAQFLAFVKANPEWRKSRIKPLFAEHDYLKRWRADLEMPPRSADRPVTNVSWFAAQAYCEARGRTLPTTEQWEYALADLGRDKASIYQRSIDWFGTPNTAALPGVGQSPRNGFGVQDLVGLVWEWTEDFDSFMTGTELRDTDSKDSAQFCGNGSTGVKDATDYPAFMRYSLRTSLKASYTTDNIGFRCAGD